MNIKTNSTPKELLSNHVEEIFKGYRQPGLHICDLATGGGKSYTIAKLACCYYPDYFNRIVILCVQNKLVDGINQEIKQFTGTKESKIKTEEVLVVHNNAEVISSAIKEGSLDRLIDEMQLRVDKEKKKDRNSKENSLHTRLSYFQKSAKESVETLSKLFKSKDSYEHTPFLQDQINDCEQKLRRDLRAFFSVYWKIKGNPKKHYKEILKDFPNLKKAFPQVEVRNKKILIMTIHKAMYGIDPLLSEKIHLGDFTENKKTLIIFDESDQAAVAMRHIIIDKAIANASGNARYATGYNGYLQYLDLISKPDQISDQYHKGLLKALREASDSIHKNWVKTFKGAEPYRNIFMENNEEISNFRRGVFFSGPIIQLNISSPKDHSKSYICHQNGLRYFTLLHSQEMPNNEVAISLKDFLYWSLHNTNIIKQRLKGVITASLQESQKKFDEALKGVAQNQESTTSYLGYPTLEREIHTLISRFESPAEVQVEKQMLDYINNRTSNFDKNKIKLPDMTVYAQGVQLFMEEIDERDNQHRVRLSCREITNTPERILVGLVSSSEASVVLCSATASSKSVISNFDIDYLKEVLGDKVSVLSKEQWEKFDTLVSQTYPSGHKIQVQAIENNTGKPLERHSMPEKYRMIFSEEARKQGLDHKWYRYTVRRLSSAQSKDSEKFKYPLNRLLQFIEAYHWFNEHADIRSMLYFQNRSGDYEASQLHVISCLIDGSFTKFEEWDDEFPSNWKNEHIETTKDWDDFQERVLKNLGSDKNTKVMLVTAYASFKAGANMQYEIPYDLETITGDTWESEEMKPKKDWDAIFLQEPTNYLSMNADVDTHTFETAIYNIMLSLMMLYERGCLSKREVSDWLYKAMNNSFYFGGKNCDGIKKDKDAWVQTILEQAVGRLCRTRHKSPTTYILYDEAINKYFEKRERNKSQTKDYIELVKHILSHQPIARDTTQAEETIIHNEAAYSKRQLETIRRKALRFLPHPYEEESDDCAESEWEMKRIENYQKIYQAYKRFIVTKPTISSLNELDGIRTMLPFIDKCYGNYQPYPTAESKVRLDILMRNPDIKAYFEANNYATEWIDGQLILHPDILCSDYAGEIGEEAFKALVVKHCGCPEERITHLEGQEYEYADFVIRNPDGTNKIAFDVKNMNPAGDHSDRTGDMPTHEKRAAKVRRLGCEIITVNMVEMPGEVMDPIREIAGVITQDGKIISSAIERISKLINN